ncbi:MAG: DUF86 domain-containing protein, partial [Rhodospirillaceae bacterium]|nr:DUF86 domain-containing protein [Rhodospirillaceae bacterium]
MEFAAFLASPTVQRSVIYCLQCISEAAVKLGYHAEEHAPEADWRNIRGFGNISRHDYGEIDLTLVWSILRDGLPGLKRSCER